MDADLMSDDGHAVTDSSQKLLRVRRVPLGYRTNTFTNEVKQDKEIPVKCCAVCCRLLYKEEQFVQDQRAALEEGATQAFLDSMTWPLLNYRDHKGERIRKLDIKENGKNAGAVVVCARHKSGGSQDLNSIISYVSCVRIK
jgi:hypothetical protein